MIETLKIINRLQSNNVIAKYAIGGAVGANFESRILNERMDG